jgi:hypothetical protein
VLDPAVSPRLYRLVLANLALCLFLTGKRSDLVLAETYICKARQLFKGVSRRSQERAKLDWITAMIRHRLNQGRPCRRRQMIRRAIDTFLELDMELEAVAAVSDLACMVWHCDEYRECIREVLSALRGRLRNEALAPAVAEALRELGPPIEAAGFDAHLNLRAAIEKLRTACSEADETGTRVLACLLTWPTLHATP